MRIVSILTALIAAGALYMLVMERALLFELAGRSVPAVEEETLAGVAEDAVPEAVQSAVSEGAGGAAEDAAEDAAAETLDDPSEAVKRVAVVALRSEAQEVGTAVVLRGRTEAARKVEARAETSGRVISEPIRRGTEVSEGQVLCEIDPGTRYATLDEARARLAEARARLPEARARFEEAQARLTEAEINDRAASSLQASGFAAETRVAATAAAVSTAKAQVETARAGLEAATSGVQGAAAAVAAAETEIDRLTIEAPFGGVLEEDTAELGLLMQPGAVCATILKLDPIELVGFVPEAEIERVEVGAPARARLVSGSTVEGEVTYLSRSADPATRTFRVDVEVPNPDLAIRDGQTVEIAIETEGAAAHLLPASALTLDDAGLLGVRVAEATGDRGDVARFVPVRLLEDRPEGMVVAGLPQEARVIVVGQEYVTDGVPVAVTLREAMPGRDGALEEALGGDPETGAAAGAPPPEAGLTTADGAAGEVTQ